MNNSTFQPVSLREIGYFYGGLTGKSGKDFGRGNSRYITFMNVIKNVIAESDLIEFVEIKDGERQNKVSKGDLLFNGSSETPEEVAFPSLVTSDLEGLYLNSFCFGFRFDKLDIIDPLFFAYYLRSNYGRQFMSQLAQGSTRYNISKRALLDVEWRLPNVKEQKAIAEALSDINDLIRNLTSLLKKKTMLFEGTRHELLSGKRRLPSYANEWKLTKVADLVTVDWGNTNLTKASYKNGGQYLAVSATGIDGHIDHFEHEAYVPVISAIGALCGKMMLPKSKFVAIKNTITLTPFKNKVDGAFIFHFFNYCQLPIRGGAQPFISKGDVEKFEILLPIQSPDSYQEQKEIGSILEDMSSEIDEIQVSIQKYEWLKQGMMNDLLTGKVRLV